MRKTPEFALYLRPFQSEGEFEYSRPGIGRFFGVLSLDFYLEPDEVVYIEGQIEKALKNDCRVIAIGGESERTGPGKTLTPVGEKWEDSFKLLARAARLIFVLPLPSPSTLWEIEWLNDHEVLWKTYFIMPPRRTDDEFLKQWRSSAASLAQFSLTLPPYDSTGGVFQLERNCNQVHVIKPDPTIFTANAIRSMIRKAYLQGPDKTARSDDVRDHE